MTYSFIADNPNILGNFLFFAGRDQLGENYLTYFHIWGSRILWVRNMHYMFGIFRPLQTNHVCDNFRRTILSTYQRTPTHLNLSRVKARSSPARGYKFGCVCSYMAGHYPAPSSGAIFVIIDSLEFSVVSLFPVVFLVVIHDYSWHHLVRGWQQKKNRNFHQAERRFKERPWHVRSPLCKHHMLGEMPTREML